MEVLFCRYVTRLIMHREKRWGGKNDGFLIRGEEVELMTGHETVIHTTWLIVHFEAHIKDHWINSNKTDRIFQEIVRLYKILDAIKEIQPIQKTKHGTT